jgi:hypothetical protein
MSSWFNSVQAASLFRSVLAYLGVYLVTRGIFDQATWDALAGAVGAIGAAMLVIVPTLYGLWVRRNAGLVSAAATVPAVTAIVTNNAAAAEAVPSAKVMTAQAAKAVL